MSRPVGVSMATADVLARSRAALREAELIDAKYAHLAASLNLRPAMPTTTSSPTQTPPKEARATTAISNTIRQSTQDRQSCRQQPDIANTMAKPQTITERHSNRWSFLDNAPKPTTTDKTTTTQAIDLAATAARREQTREARRKRIADELERGVQARAATQKELEAKGLADKAREDARAEHQKRRADIRALCKVDCEATDKKFAAQRQSYLQLRASLFSDKTSAPAPSRTRAASSTRTSSSTTSRSTSTSSSTRSKSTATNTSTVSSVPTLSSRTGSSSSSVSTTSSLKSCLKTRTTMTTTAKKSIKWDRDARTGQDKVKSATFDRWIDPALHDFDGEVLKLCGDTCRYNKNIAGDRIKARTLEEFQTIIQPSIDRYIRRAEALHVGCTCPRY